ncbi:MAG: hypothetical protein SGBAC_005720 [Bacillariaceae sp.]
MVATVTFQEDVSTMSIPSYVRHIDNDPLWYSPLDLNSFKTRDKYIAECLQKHKSNSRVARIHIQSELGDCLRGLEQRHPKAPTACAAVLEEQRRQKQDCSLVKVDEKAIAKIYAHMSSSPKRVALLVAARDEQYAKTLVKTITSAPLTSSQTTKARTSSDEERPKSDSNMRRIRSYQNKKSLRTLDNERCFKRSGEKSKSFRIPRKRTCVVV